VVRNNSFYAALFFIFFIFSIALSSFSFAEENGLFHNSFSSGVLKIGGLRASSLFWKGNFDSDDLFLGLDVNLLLSERRPEGFESLVLRRLDWDTGTEGVLYAPIVDLNFGHGLLLQNYSTLDRQNVIFNNEATGLRAYYLAEAFDFEVFGTWSHLYGLRASQDIFGMTFGQTVVADIDGERVLCSDGSTRQISQKSGYSVDIWAPLFGDFDLYAEGARIEDAGSGYSAGLHWGYDVIAVALSARVEWRYSEMGFAPGYFSWNYETNPIDLSTLEAHGKPRSGYFASLRGFILNVVNLNAAYEGYDDSNGAFYMDAWGRVYDNLSVSAHLKQPSFAEYRCTSLLDGTQVGASIRYDLSPSLFFGARVKRGFDPVLGEPVESTLFEIGSIL
jgi:hypothetical protein